MNPNHKPNWQQWTPPECKDYWQQCFSNEVKQHNEFIQEYFQETGIQISDQESHKDFANNYQLSVLNKIENLLIDSRAEKFWIKIKKLGINEHYFLINFTLALNGGCLLNGAKKRADIAAGIETKTLDLINEINEKDNLYFSFEPNTLNALNKILNDSRYTQRKYQQKKSLVPTNDSRLFDDLIFCRTLTSFFEQQARLSLDEYVAICASIALNKKISTERVKKIRVNSNKKQIVEN